MNKYGWISLVAVLALGACTKDDTDDTDPTESDTDTDSDSDSDADADTDSDSDTDADTDVPLAPFEGYLTYKRTTNDIVACDVDVTVLSTGDYTGDCLDCAFAFDVDAAVTEERTACEFSRNDAYYTFQNKGGLTDTWIGWMDNTVVSPGDYSELSYIDTVLRGYTELGDADYRALAGTYELTYYDELYTGPIEDGSETSFDGTTLELTILADSSDNLGKYAAVCEERGEEVVAKADAEPLLEDLPCNDVLVDVWNFTVASDSEVTVSVDVTNAEAAGDPAFLIIGPDECQIADIDDSFACTVAPKLCPAFHLPSGSAPGQYSVVAYLYHTGSSAAPVCTGNTSGHVDYEIRMDGATPTLAADDEDAFTHDEYDVSMTATITE